MAERRQEPTCAKNLVEIRNLTVKYKSKVKEIAPLKGINLSVRSSEIIAIVGESGCGKSTLGVSIINLLQKPPAYIESGEIFFQGKDILRLAESEMARVRGTGISMIFQEPISSLDPVYTIGRQIQEAIDVREGRALSNPGPFTQSDPELEKGTSGGISRLVRVQLPSFRKSIQSTEITDVLRKVQISDPEKVLDKYPHELSGGMAQRVMIAQALVEKPALMIADEPTSALDVTTQAQILGLMKSLRDEIGSSILFITHDLAVAAQIADRIVVMYAGELIEIGDVDQIFREPLHPYTEGLLNSFPRKYHDEGKLEAIPGDVPDLGSPPPGCMFHPRCKYVFDRCKSEHPLLVESVPGRKAACFLRYPK